MIIIYSAMLLAALGLISGSFLALAAAKFKVKADPREKLVEAALPGANCGACGFPGCSAFAKAIVKGEANPEGCIPGKRTGTPETIKKIMDAEQEKIDDIWEKSEEDPDKALELLEGKNSGAQKKKSKTPSKPTKEEKEKYEAQLKNNTMASAIYGVLPNIDCGLCGCKGCAHFAIEVSKDNIEPEKCVPGKRQNVAENIEKLKKMDKDEVKKLMKETDGNPGEIKKKVNNK
ncbi:MAG: RnfABCDGE type electron transport complex subunit B [Kosmotogaceae bacterium]